MHKFLAVSTLALAGVIAAPQAHAIVDTDFGVKVGMTSLENDASAAKNIGLVWNIEFVHMFGMELEGNTTVSDGRYDTPLGGVDYKDRQLGAYATLTTPGPVYFKAKAGYVNNHVEIGNSSSSDTDMGYGIGVGFTTFELELTRSKFKGNNVDLLSASFKF